MSNMTGAAPPKVVLSLGLDLGGPWHQRGVWSSSAPVRVYPGGARGARRRLRLPSIGAAAKGPRRRDGMARFRYAGHQTGAEDLCRRFSVSKSSLINTMLDLLISAKCEGKRVTTAGWPTNVTVSRK